MKKFSIKMRNRKVAKTFLLNNVLFDSRVANLNFKCLVLLSQKNTMRNNITYRFVQGRPLSLKKSFYNIQLWKELIINPVFIICPL
jgi:hypothetical protein